MNWKKITKNLRETRIAECLVKKVDFHTASYQHELIRQWITLNGVELLSLHCCMYCMGNRISEDHPLAALYEHGTLGDSLWSWHEMSIEKMLNSDNVFLKSMALWDRRFGKRRLLSFKLENASPLERIFYAVRMDALGYLDHGISITDEQEALSAPTFNQINKRQRKLKSLEAEKQLNLARQQTGVITIAKMLSKKETIPETSLGAILRKNARRVKDRKLWLSQLEHIDKVSKLFEEEEHLKRVLRLLPRTSVCVRSPLTWKPKSKNREKQFSSLARHIWSKFPVPSFLDQVWNKDEGREVLFIAVGAGESLWKYRDLLPCKLSRRELHLWMQTPESMSLELGCRWAQIRALDGNFQTLRGIQDSRLVRDFSQEDFSRKLIAFFIRNPMLDPAQCTPIIDYIWQHKFERQIVETAEGQRILPPPQPEFSLTGRTVEGLLQRVEAWHQQLGKSRKRFISWPKSSFPNWSRKVGKEESTQQLWHMVELTSSEELNQEGKALRHCVATYVHSCAKKRVSIWSLKLQSGDLIQRKLTIEVCLQNNEVRQIRGLANRMPKPDEIRILQKWADENEISLPTH